MKLFKLTRLGTIPGYDVYNEQVVVAQSEERARELCYSADEGAIWTDPTKVECVEIHIDTLDECVLVADFNAG